jgi:hypothetical protein
MTLHRRLERLEEELLCRLCREWPNVRPGALAELPDRCTDCGRAVPSAVPAFLASFDPGGRALAHFSDADLETCIRVVARCFAAGYVEDDPLEPEERAGTMHRPENGASVGTAAEWRTFLAIDAALNRECDR